MGKAASPSQSVIAMPGWPKPNPLRDEPGCEPWEYGLRSKLLVGLFGGMLLAFGIANAIVGVQAIRARAYEFRWGARHERQKYVEHYRGVDAVRVGAGFASGGIMLAVWGASIVGSLSRRVHRVCSGPTVRKTLTWVSTVAFFLACLLLFPIWQPWAWSFYAPALIAAVVRWFGRREWFPVIFFAIIGCAVFIPALALLSALDRRSVESISASLALGIFAMAVAGAHVLALAAPESSPFQRRD